MKWKSYLGIGLALALLLWLWRKTKNKNTTALPVQQKALQMHGQAFVDKTKAIERQMGMPPGTLFSIMYSESGLKHNVFNSIGAGGLIGFLPSTLEAQGYTPDDLKNMTALRQLDLVRTFYQKWKDAGILGKAKKPEDFYMLTFYPYAVGKPDSYELGSHNGTARTVYSANSPLDWNKDGRLTVADFKAYLRNHNRLKGTIFQV